MSEPGRKLLIGDVVRRAAEATPRAPAVCVGAPDRGFATRTFGELERDANRLALALRSALGIGHGDRVLVWADTSIEVLPLFIAVARLGAVFAPLNARLGAAEAGAIAGLARGTLLVADADRAAQAPVLAAAAGIDQWALLRVGEAGRARANADRRDDSAHLILDATALPDPPGPIDEPRLEETDPHVIFFTSGSTGRPKGVVLSHRANWLRGFQGVFRDEPERTVCMFPLFHMAAFTLAIAAWQTRGEITYTDASAEALLGAVEARRANRLYGLPLVWKRIVEADLARYDLRSLVQLDSGTSATPIELLERMRARFPDAKIRIYYGSTEVGSATALSDADVLRKPGSVGLPSVHVEVRLDADGEILVRSPYLMDGYFDDPDATAAAFEDGWFRMGDLGALDDEGHLAIVGRKKEILRTGGESVAPNEVEAVLRDCPGVAEVAIVGLPDPDWGDVLCAAVVAAPGARPTLAQLRDHCEGRLAGFKKPRRLALLERLPRTPATSQVQRTMLVEEIQSRGLAKE
ncbi:MAG: class I adenylate-forming enzyme family protein [Myxococcota bacterium]